MLSTIKKRHKILVAALLAVLTITILFFFTQKSKEADNNKVMPDAMKELAQSGLTKWMAGMWVDLINCESLPEGTIPEIPAYSNGGDVIEAIVTVQNGLDQSQDYYLMVFEDGLPVEYTIEGQTYLTYPIELTSAQSSYCLEFSSDFSLHMGRLDFLLFYNEDPQSDFHMTTYTAWLDQGEAETLPDDLQPTVEQRAGIQNHFSGDSYGAWFWEGSPSLTADTHIGPREIVIDQGDTLLFEAVTVQPGKYRTVVILDGAPISFTIDGEEHKWIDWEADGTNMLQIPITLSENISASGSIFTVTTPLGIESMPLYTLASPKIQVTNTLAK